LGIRHSDPELLLECCLLDLHQIGHAYRRRKFCGICRRHMAGSAVNNARAIFGVILAAAALASVATLHHVLSSRPLSPPQAIEAPKKAGSLALRETVAQEFADLPRSIHTVPIIRPAAPTPAASEPERPTQTSPPRVATQPDIPTTSPSHAQPVDVCARYGGHRVDFMRGHHGMWRCIYPRHR
jgi:hypothetical protein